MSRKDDVDIIITEWALASYVELKGMGAFSLEEYKTTLRPDILLLKDGLPLKSPKFRNSKFWGPAQDINGVEIPCGYKMKWHNMGNGKNEIRLTIALLEERAFLCHAYVKTSDTQDKRFSSRLKNRIADIRVGSFAIRGRL